MPLRSTLGPFPWQAGILPLGYTSAPVQHLQGLPTAQGEFHCIVITHCIITYIIASGHLGWYFGLLWIMCIFYVNTSCHFSLNTPLSRITKSYLNPVFRAWGYGSVVKHFVQHVRPWIQFPLPQNSIFNFKELQDYPDIYLLSVEWKKRNKKGRHDCS